MKYYYSELAYLKKIMQHNKYQTFKIALAKINSFLSRNELNLAYNISLTHRLPPDSIYNSPTM